MDNTITLYLIKASVSLALFYGLYMLFLKGDTFFKVRRIYFLFAIAFSLLFPVFVLEIPIQQTEVEAPIYMSWLPEMEAGDIVVTPEVKPTFDTWHLLGLIVVVVSAFLIARLAIQLLSLIKLRIKNPSHKVSSFRIIELHDQKMSPFSFFNWIFINADQQDKEKFREVIAHEQIHVKQLHSIDVILFELLCVCFWWNPFAWLLRNEMRLNLEYLADQGVLQAGFDSKAYQYILLQSTNKNTGIPIINNFNVSQLKKRIIMINKKNTSLYKVAKYMLALPLGLVLLLGNSVQATSDMTGLIINELNDNVTSPEFPGGEDARNHFLFNNLKYPIEAQKAGIQDQVMVKFAVSKTGEIGKIEITSKSDELLNDEVIRIVRAMPKWTPSKKDGVAVESESSLSVVFKIKGIESKASKARNGDVVVVGYGISGAAVKDNEKVFQDDKPINFAEVMPKFPGGEDAMQKFIADNLKYPVVAQESGIQGRVTLRFVVSKTGKIKDVTVVRGIDPACDREALRIVKAMPTWLPGKQDGKVVDVYFTLPIIFKLNDEDQVIDKEQVVSIKEVKGGNGTFNFAEVMPKFPGGEDAMKKFIADNLKYPVVAQESGTQGRVTLRFIVSKTGKIQDASIVRGISPECDAEALRVVNAMPDWIPGKQDGEAVDVYFTLPVVFKLTKETTPEYVFILDGKEISREALKKEVEQREEAFKKQGKELKYVELTLPEEKVQELYGDKYKGKKVVHVSFSSK